MLNSVFNPYSSFTINSNIWIPTSAAITTSFKMVNFNPSILSGDPIVSYFNHGRVLIKGESWK